MGQKVTEHFTYDELIHSEIAARNGWLNIPSEAEKANLVRLAHLLEKVREAVKRPVIVNSAYRSKKVNDAVGSKDTSQHLIGCAADIRVPGMTPRQVVEACIAALVPFDQIILEYDSWVHISVPSTPNAMPRNQRLIIDRTGTKQFV